MRFLGYLLKTLALVLAAIVAVTAPMVLEDTESEDRTFTIGFLAALGLVAVVVAVCGYALGNRAARRERVVPAAPAMSFPPGPGETWHDPAQWEHLPDPTPDVPHPRIWPAPRLPSVPVPPDEILRRLWLARAHSWTYRANAAGTGVTFGATMLGLLLAPVGLGLWFGLDTCLGDGDDAERATGLGAILGSAVFMIPVVCFGRAMWRDHRGSFRRHYRLVREIEALEAADAGRPGGGLDPWRAPRGFVPPGAVLEEVLTPDLERAVAAYPWAASPAVTRPTFGSVDDH
ncbi:hypothetical protein [Embleya sp. NPDC005575]|uniref:hypothetical protein n=1 Tax=Embleya sp. NPDC005575 TaxID=3156892 RepID=UPI0033A79726